MIYKDKKREVVYKVFYGNFATLSKKYEQICIAQCKVCFGKVVKMIIDVGKLTKSRDICVCESWINL